MIMSLQNVALELLRLSVWFLLLLLLLGGAEMLFAAHKSKGLRPAYWQDIGYFFGNGLLFKLAVVPLLSISALALSFLVPGSLQNWAISLPVSMRALLGLFVGDIAYYFVHRAMHQVPGLWRFHAVHHSAVVLDWLVSARAHPFEIVFTRWISFVVLYVLGLARPQESGMADLSTLLIFAAGIVWGFFVHANVRWRFGPLEWLIATPAFHHWHHANEAEGQRDHNYAAMFPLIDRVFSTLHLPYTLPKRYGIDEAMEADVSGQLMHPFKRH
ncbi:sterol desaturase family protein [Iodobacter sp. HSC-16F04]|uniref:Sterol desaturase family protein n=1 Tax=Iodobacter violaceini TaxID=3044271 RepID=A0ABX0KT41_9NEIS|nr:sterol desaturase family protein [Iodobacter violacea]NHQ85873.1 sterol desaturase family protein [Iodobacter violacea]